MIHKLNVWAEDIFTLNTGRIRCKVKTVRQSQLSSYILIKFSSLASSFPETETREPRIKEDTKFLDIKNQNLNQN
jgi:hypothetical protein